MIRLLVSVLRLYEVILIVRILVSWVMPMPRGPLMQFLWRITDPYLNLFRRSLPFLAAGGIDFSPIVGFIVIDIVIRILLA